MGTSTCSSRNSGPNWGWLYSPYIPGESMGSIGSIILGTCGDPGMCIIYIYIHPLE